MIDWHKVKALSFDCYGTLIDWERGILAALTPWVAQFGAPAVLAGFAAVEPDVEHAHPAWPYRRIIAEVYGQMAAEFNVARHDDDAFSFAVSVGTWPPFADTVAALAQLKKHFALFILSNVDEVSISGTLAQLETQFDGVYTAEQIGSYKPDQRNFDYLAQRLATYGYGADCHVHVAQSLFHDHVPAKAAGLQTVWIDRTGGGPSAAPTVGVPVSYDLRFASMADLAAAVDSAIGTGE